MPSTPPPSLTTSRDAARHFERSNRIMASPENRRIPSGLSVPSISTPSVHQQSFRVLPVDLSTRLTSMAPPPPPPAPSDRQTLSSAQLRQAQAALPPLIPLNHRRTPSGPLVPSTSSFSLNSNNQIGPQHSTSTLAPAANISAPIPLSSSQLAPAFGVFQSRPISHPVSV